MSRKRHKLDPALTASMGYADKRSYRTIHGGEYLFGEDIVLRRSQVYLRDRGVCQMCGEEPSPKWAWELDHIIAHSKQGDDSMENMRVLCGRHSRNKCHIKRHGRTVRWSRAVAEAR